MTINFFVLADPRCPKKTVDKGRRNLMTGSIEKVLSINLSKIQAVENLLKNLQTTNLNPVKEDNGFDRMEILSIPVMRCTSN